MPENFQYDVFLSHSSKDKPIVRPLAERLRKDGLHVFFDEGVILPGDSIPSKIEEGLERSRVLVFCMSANAFGSDWATLESQTFRFRDPLNKNRRFIPLRLDEAPIKGSLAQFLYINWLSPDREQNYSKLLEACRLLEKPSLHIAPADAQEGTLWNVSHDQNPVFTGRSEFLNSLREDLVAKGRQAIYGLGGIGKSQIALEYAYRNRANYEAVFWTFADSATSISTDFIKIAKGLNLIVQDLPEQAVIVGAVKRWLESHDGWFLIFDNAENAETVRPFLPQAGHGHILITARWPRFQTIQIMTPREVKVLPPEAAREFFLRRTGRDSSGHAVEAAEDLARELGFFPLALEQAGAFIAENQTSFEDYIRSYRKRRLELLGQQAPVLGDYKDTVATTWAINFAEVEKSPASADLLRFSAFLWPEMVPLELFEKGGAELGDRLAPYLTSVQSDPVLLDQLLKPLTDYSLISRNPQTRSYSIHLLVQEVLQSRMTTAEKKFWMEAVVRAVSAAFPEGEFKNWSECQRLLSQALLCKKYILEDDFESTVAADLLRHAGFYLHKRAQFSEAQTLYQIALAMREKIQGSEHPDAADSFGKLGLLYRDQAKYAQAENLLRSALEVREKVLGSEHPDTATSANDLAGLYMIVAKYREAEALFRRALLIRENLLEANHPQVAESLHDLAVFLERQARYSEAQPLYLRALAIREKAQGQNHPETASSLNNMAQLLLAQGKYGDSEPLHRRALGINEKALGLEHPETATNLNNLAGLLRLQGKFGEAEPLYRRALAIHEKALGPEHPETATNLNNLAGLLQQQGKYEEAEPLFRHALVITEKALGPAHPETAANLNNLAGLLRAQGKYGEAEPLYRRALAINEKALGPEHPDTAASLTNLAGLLRAQGKYGEAEPLYRRALAIDEKALGPEHPFTAISLNSLAGLLQQQGKYGKAEPLFRRGLAINEKVLGPEHPDTATNLNDLAQLLRSQGKDGESEPLYHRALTIYEKALGLEHPFTAINLGNLGGLLRAQGKYEEAELLFRRALTINEKVLGLGHPEIAACLHNLAALRQEQHNYTEAEPLYRRALAINEKALGSEHPDTATDLNNLARLLEEQDRCKEAEPLYRRALAIREKVFDRNHPDIAHSLAGLASLHRRLGNNKKAKGFEQRARRIIRKKH